MEKEITINPQGMTLPNDPIISVIIGKHYYDIECCETPSDKTFDQLERETRDLLQHVHLTLVHTNDEVKLKL